MRYFIIAGEASGDIHGSALIASLKEQDNDAQIEFLGGDLMVQNAGHEPLIHYRDMAFMGFIEVIKHLGSILGFMKVAKEAIASKRPDALILIDYPSFNLKMAKWVKQHGIPVFYFISPKVVLKISSDMSTECFQFCLSRPSFIVNMTMRWNTLEIPL